MDLSLVINEMVDEKVHLANEGMVFKINFEKTYDQVDCDLPNPALLGKGLVLNWHFRFKVAYLWLVFLW